MARSGSLSGETLFVRVDPSNPRVVMEPRLYRRIERRRGKNEKKDKPPKNKGRERYQSSCFLLSPAPSPDEDEAAGKKGSPPPYRRWHRRNLPSPSPPRPRTPMRTWIPKSKSWAEGASTSSRADCEDLVARMDALWGGTRVEEPEATKRKPRLPSPPPRLPLSSIENLASGPASPDPFTVFSALPKGASRALLSSETPSPVPKGGARGAVFGLAGHGGPDPRARNIGGGVQTQAAQEGPEARAASPAGQPRGQNSRGGGGGAAAQEASGQAGGPGVSPRPVRAQRELYQARRGRCTHPQCCFLIDSPIHVFLFVVASASYLQGLGCVWG